MSAKDDALDYIYQASADELTELRKAIGQRSSRLTRTFQVGESVEFDAKGFLRKGKVVKVNTKTVKILTENSGIWNVAGSLLRRSPKPV